MSLQLWLIPLLSALIGWITNVAAVRLLFWPVRPLRLRGLPWVLQGVVPRRQAEIARSIGDLVEQLLVRPHELAASLNAPACQAEAMAALSRYVETRVEQTTGRYLPAGIRAAATRYLTDALQREATQAARAMLGPLQLRLQEELRLAAVVAERVASLDPAEFEVVLLRVVGRELRWLELLGAVMGFIIGLVQLALIASAT